MPQSRGSERRWLRHVAWTLSVLLIAAMALGSLLWQAARAAPDFYERALAAPPPERKQSGRRLEQRVADLQRSVHDSDLWSVAFSEEQVNGWLSYDLPEKFPEWTSTQVKQPRVAFDDDLVRLAFQYCRGSLETVISVDANVSLTDQPNELAVRFQRARAGLLPLPLDQLIPHVDRAAARTRTPLRWIQVDNLPVALIRLSLVDQQRDREVFLDAVAARPGELRLGGRAFSGTLK
jgi:hypothetical protein